MGNKYPPSAFPQHLNQEKGKIINKQLYSASKEYHKLITRHLVYIISCPKSKVIKQISTLNNTLKSFFYLVLNNGKCMHIYAIMMKYLQDLN